jgi:hypothetical protein
MPREKAGQDFQSTRDAPSHERRGVRPGDAELLFRPGLRQLPLVTEKPEHSLSGQASADNKPVSGLLSIQTQTLTPRTLEDTDNRRHSSHTDPSAERFGLTFKRPAPATLSSPKNALNFALTCRRCVWSRSVWNCGWGVVKTFAVVNSRSIFSANCLWSYWMCIFIPPANRQMWLEWRHAGGLPNLRSSRKAIPDDTTVWLCNDAPALPSWVGQAG